MELQDALESLKEIPINDVGIRSTFDLNVYLDDFITDAWLYSLKAISFITIQHCNTDVNV